MKNDARCKDCSLRQKYDTNPKSLLGRFWHWHIGFCPGWKGYLSSLDDDEREIIMKKYK